MSPPVQSILLVEPEAVLADVTSFRLELLGYEVRTVESAEAALEAIEIEPPDLIITNLELPQMPGMTLIEKISSDETTSSIPIMVLSFEADLDHVQAVHRAGATEFLVVPFQPETLAEKVARQLDQARNTEKTTKEKVSAE